MSPATATAVNFTAPSTALARATQLVSAAPAAPALAALFTATVVAAQTSLYQVGPIENLLLLRRTRRFPF